MGQTHLFFAAKHRQITFHTVTKMGQNKRVALKSISKHKLLFYLIPYLHKSKPDNDPNHFAYTGNQRGIHSVSSGKGKTTDSKGKTTFTTSHLHRQEEQKISQ